MAASPKIKVYSADAEYVAAFKFFEDAAAFVAVLGNGATVRTGHRAKDTVWTEGAEEASAGESYDRAAETMRQRSRHN